MAIPGKKSARKASRNDCTSLATITDTKDVAAVADSATGKADTAIGGGGGRSRTTKTKTVILYYIILCKLL